MKLSTALTAFFTGMALAATGVWTPFEPQAVPQAPLPAVVLPQPLQPPMMPSDPQDPERQIPAGHYCQNHTDRRMAPNAHECHCDYSCVAQGDDQGNVWYETQEMLGCKAYCHKEGRHCTCWPEAPCPKPA